MSIINQTLKELDRRQGQQQAGKASVAYESRKTGWALRVAVFGGVMLLAAIFVVLLLGLLRDNGAEAELRVDRTPVNVQPEPAAAVNESATAATETTVLPVLIPATQVRTRAPDDEAEAAVAEQAAAAERPTEEEAEPQATRVDEEAAEAQVPADESEGQMQIQRVERDAGELAQQKLDRALELLEQGEGRRAEQLMQEALVLNPESIATRQQLAAYYYGRGFSSQALRLLREGLSYAPNNTRLVMLKARIYEESNRPQEALRVLKGVRAELPQNADLITLRAALANETGDYAEAASSYRTLVDWRPTNGVWWLGLGIAHDYLDESLAATAAYREALSDPNLNEDSRRFALQRLEAL